MAWATSILVAFQLGSSARKRAQADYLLLLDRASGPELTTAEVDARVDEYRAWAEDLHERGVLVAAERLNPNEDRFGPGGSVGTPSGFFLLRTDDANEAASVARACPHLRHGGTVSLRAIDRR